MARLLLKAWPMVSLRSVRGGVAAAGIVILASTAANAEPITIASTQGDLAARLGLSLSLDPDYFFIAGTGGPVFDSAGQQDLSPGGADAYDGVAGSQKASNGSSLTSALNEVLFDNVVVKLAWHPSFPSAFKGAQSPASVAQAFDSPLKAVAGRASGAVTIAVGVICEDNGKGGCTGTIEQVPEPSSLLIMLSAVGIGAFMRRRVQ